jgi:hypothetical protein
MRNRTGRVEEQDQEEMRTRKRQGTEPGRDEELEQEEMKNRTRKR